MPLTPPTFKPFHAAIPARQITVIEADACVLSERQHLRVCLTVNGDPTKIYDVFVGTDLAEITYRLHQRYGVSMFDAGLIVARAINGRVAADN